MSRWPIAIRSSLAALALLTLPLALAPAEAVAQQRINMGCPAINDADLGSMTVDEIKCKCFQSGPSCQATGMSQPSVNDVLTCGQHRAMAERASRNPDFVEGQASVQIVETSCAGLSDDDLPGTASAIPDVPSGAFTFERGYYGNYTGAKLEICQPFYSGQAVVEDGIISFTSGGHDWRGVITPDRFIYISRDGVTNPRPKNDTGVTGPIDNASLFNGYCGQGFFRLIGL
jgi:hypothetical protein